MLSSNERLVEVLLFVLADDRRSAGEATSKKPRIVIIS